MIKLSPTELKETLTYIINNNAHIQASGQTPISVAVEGHSGIGKTSVIIQLANELEMSYRKINLAQIEELGDLTGYPIKEYRIRKEDEVLYVPENVLGLYVKMGYHLDGEPRMSYAIPEWVQSLPPNSILIFDDFTRAD